MYAVCSYIYILYIYIFSFSTCARVPVISPSQSSADQYFPFVQLGTQRPRRNETTSHEIFWGFSFSFFCFSFFRFHVVFYVFWSVSIPHFPFSFACGTHSVSARRLVVTPYLFWTKETAPSFSDQCQGRLWFFFSNAV